jgi:protein-S-isoprenylcysteine O-methyltransferase Ste14
MNRHDSNPRRTAAVPSPFGWIPLPVRMLFYAVGFLGLVLVALPWLFHQLDVWVPAVHVEMGWFRIVGVVLFVVSFSLYSAASYVLTRRGKGAYVEFDPPTELVVVGPYRYVRNPIVAFLLGSMLGEALSLSSTGVLLMFLVFLVLSHLQVTRLEEPLLRKRFGRAYDEYRAHVPRWMPRLTPWKAP